MLYSNSTHLSVNAPIGTLLSSLTVQVSESCFKKIATGSDLSCNIYIFNNLKKD